MRQLEIACTTCKGKKTYTPVDVPENEIAFFYIMKVQLRCQKCGGKGFSAHSTRTRVKPEVNLWVNK